MKWSCEICGKEIEVTICCNAFDCGCRGLPEFPFCSEKCFDKYINGDTKELNDDRQKNSRSI